MNKLARVLAVAAILGMGLVGTSALAATRCNGLITGEVNGGVVVNNGDVCFLGGNIILGPGTLHQGALVAGGVRVNAGGILFVCASTINGGIVADGALSLIVGAEEILCDGGVINGGVQISNTAQGSLEPGTPPSVALENSVIHGAVHFSGNLGRIAVAGDTISGGLFCSNDAFDLEDEHDVGAPPSVITGKVTCEFE